MSDPKKRVKSQDTRVKMSEGKHSAPDSYRDDIPHSEIKEPAIEQMEVHHHPQLEHKPKPWKEYLLEGFMIFAAVTMGFFAESLREHITNNEREEQYIHSLAADLKDDTTRMAAYIKYQTQSLHMLDSLIAILNDPANISKHGNEIYYFGRLGPRIQNAPINMRTIEQLKNSGNFRLIADVKTSNDITAYYAKVPLIRQIEGLFAEEFVQYKKIAGDVFEPATFQKLQNANGDVIMATDNPPLQKNAGASIKELAINAVYMNGSRKAVLAEDEKLLRNAKELLASLQEQYRLHDE